MNTITLSSPHSKSTTFHLEGNTLLRENTPIDESKLSSLEKLQVIEARFALDPELQSVGEHHREQFFQNPALWHHRGKYEITPETWTKTRGEPHPVRPGVPDGDLYRRFVPALQKTVSIRKITPADVETFHRWHNSPRVSFFWELNKSKDELAKYIEDGRKDPHQVPVILEVENKPVGYFELYWVKEDRLGAYYDSEAFDRGFHFLIGEKEHLGAVNTDAFVKAVLHFMYLDEGRTRRIMAEPRADNAKVLKYAEASIGWKKLKEFNFPHKRSALLENRREVFFQGLPL